MGNLLRFNPELYRPELMEAYRALYPTQESRKLTIYSTAPEAKPESVEQARAFFASHPGRSRFIRETIPGEFDAVTGTDAAFFRTPQLWIEIELLPNGHTRATARFRGSKFWHDEQINSDAAVCDLIEECDRRGGVRLSEIVSWAEDESGHMEYMRQRAKRKARKG